MPEDCDLLICDAVSFTLGIHGWDHIMSQQRRPQPDYILLQKPQIVQVNVLCSKIKLDFWEQCKERKGDPQFDVHNFQKVLSS